MTDEAVNTITSLRIAIPSELLRFSQGWR